MRTKNMISFLVAAILIFAICFVCVFDVTIGDYRFPDALDEEYGIKQGLDLVGGSIIEFEPQEGYTPTAEEMDTVESIMRNRLDSQAYYDAPVAVQGDNTVRIEIPNIDDPSQAVSLLGSTAELTFRDYTGAILMEGSDVYVKNAVSQYGQIDQSSGAQHFVALELTDEGRAKFKAATEKVLAYETSNRYIGIYLDENAVSTPAVSQVIDGTSCVITGNFDKDSADTLAAQIRSGQLPFKLQVAQLQSVGPTLGEEALSKSLIAGGIGLLLVLIFMIFMYRLPGVIAGISLCGYTALVVMLMIWSGSTLTLAGIAGIILSIGMAVDADCIIFERIKEELRLGKTIGSAIDAAFNRALVAIIDANITTLIAAVVLYFFGTGSIKGFAVTLFIGTIVSLFTAIILTKFLLNQLVKGIGIKSPTLFGVKNVKTETEETEKKSFNFVAKSKIFAIISAALVVIGVVGLIAGGGLNYGIEFTGGTTLQVEMGDVEFDSDEMKKLVSDTVGMEAQVQVLDGGRSVLIKTGELGGYLGDDQAQSDTNEVAKIYDAIEEKYGVSVPENERNVTTIGESTSKKILTDSMWAVLIAVALMLVYITIRFEFTSGLAAVIGLVQNILIMIGFYAILRSPVNNSFVAAILTIVGYSINNTIVIFDRVRENTKKMRNASYEEIANVSVRQTLSRTINSSVTTLLTIGMVYILGVASIKEFALPIIIGILAGTYASIFLCAPFWAWIKNKMAARRMNKATSRK